MVKNLVTDCDGVLTDGKYYYSKKGRELKAFHANDSVGIKKVAMADGLRVIFVSSDGDSAINEKRARDLGVEFVYTKFGKKVEGLEKVVSLSETAYVGDCIDDIPVFDKAAVSFAPANALEPVRKAADHILTLNGGEGCILEAALILRSLREKDS